MNKDTVAKIAILQQFGDLNYALSLRYYYIDYFRAAGLDCCVIAYDEDLQRFEQSLTSFDGIVICGGDDLNLRDDGFACSFDEACLRQKCEIIACRVAANNNIPFFGICRGHQVANLAFGGSIYKDVPSEYKTSIKHNNDLADDASDLNKTHHLLYIDQKFGLYKLLSKESILVNSYHHQGVKELASCFDICAYTKDGLIEAFMHKSCDFFLGVQFHPELMPLSEDTQQLALSFAQACRSYHINNIANFNLSNSINGFNQQVYTLNPQPKFAESYVESICFPKSKNLEYEQEFLFEMQSLNGDEASRRAAWDYIKSSTAIFAGIPVYTSFVPKLFDQNTYDFCKISVDKIYKILCKVIERFKQDVQYRNLFNYDERLLELMLLPAQVDAPLPFARFDFFLDEQNFNMKFCEFNTDGSSGMNENREAYLSIQNSASYKAFCKNHDCHVDTEYLFEGWVDKFLEIYKTYPKAKDNPHICIVDYLENGVTEEFKLYGHIFEERGYKFSIYDIRNLEYDGKNLIGKRAFYGQDGAIIDALWRRSVASDCLRFYNESLAYFNAIKDDNVFIIGSFATNIVHDKQIFRVLHNPQTSAFLDNDEQDFIKRHVPFTSYLDEKYVNLDKIIDEKDAWVIKPCDGYGSSDVCVGRDFSASEWSKIIHEHANSKTGFPFLAQEFCSFYKSSALPFYDEECDYTANPYLYNNLSGLFAIDGKFSGIFSRLGPNSIILGKRGGVTAPTIWVDVQR
ncbi:MAG: gamma-glutamyl-gamma-aminobutyrate hydrolase family protein [Coriobacteriales bacterium]|nr:gamma-glutamyl-gamma-aminobutyrate hydrolase family protein [Coriobacteriales bacterium]